jgi:hypothetical protein
MERLSVITEKQNKHVTISVQFQMAKKLQILSNFIQNPLMKGI